MFDESERRHPIQEEERIKVENIHGKIIFIGAEDDVLWDTFRYMIFQSKGYLPKKKLKICHIFNLKMPILSGIPFFSNHIFLK